MDRLRKRPQKPAGVNFEKVDHLKSLRSIARSAFILACVVAASDVANAGGGATDIGSYRWINVRPTVPFDPTMWAPRAGLRPSIMTFGGDRERFGLPSNVNAFLIENDVWQFSP
jgi:hypothetical protein